MKIYNVSEKFSINPINISTLNDIESYTYIIWFELKMDILEFFNKTSKLVSMDDVVYLPNNFQLVVIDENTFKSCQKALDDFSYRLFVSKINKEKTRQYLEDNINANILSFIGRGKHNDKNIEFIGWFYANLTEKLNIEPITISNLPIVQEYVYIDPMTIKYEDIVPGYIIFVRGENTPFVCMNRQSTDNLNIHTYEGELFLVNYNYRTHLCEYIELTDYFNTFPNDCINGYFDIVKIYEPSEMITNVVSKNDFLDYYKKLMDYFVYKELQ